MPIAYHTHSFEIPTATNAETQAGSISDKVVVPSGLGAVLASYVTSTALTTTLAGYATAAQGAKADTAIQPGSNRLVPAGGATGQVLAKTSATDYATGWTAVIAGNMLAAAYDTTGFGVDVFGGGIRRATVAAAIADAPAVDPEYYDIAYFDTAYQTGSGAKYRKVAVEPTHPGKFRNRNGTGSWYEIAVTTLRPEMFGRIGVNAAGDTAALEAMGSALSDGMSVVASGEYLVAGSPTIASGVNGLDVDVSGAIFRQQNTFSRTLNFFNCTDVRVHGAGTFHGKGGAAGEFNGLSGSWNGVCAVWFENCDRVIVDGIITRDHAGGSVWGRDTPTYTVINCDLAGIGPDYIVDNDNGSDFAVGFTFTLANYTDLPGRAIISNNRMRDHAFGIAGQFHKSLISIGNELGPFPGQHAYYMADSGGVQISHNVIRGCGEIGIKWHFYRTAVIQLNIPAWQGPGYSYAAGEEIRAYSSIYYAKAAFVSGASVDADLNAGMFAVSPKNDIEGLVITDNIIEDCQEGIHIVEGEDVVSYNSVVTGVNVSGNVIRRMAFGEPAGGYGIKAERWVGAISRNVIEDTQSYGIYVRNGRGDIKDNLIRRSIACGITGSFGWGSAITGNILEDCGLSGVDGGQIPISITNHTVANLPNMQANPTLNIDRNTITFIGTDTPNTYQMSVQSNYKVSMSGNRGTSLKPVLISGELLLADDNSFPRILPEGQQYPSGVKAGNPYRQFYGDAPPTGGFYYKNEKVWNSDPATGEPAYWYCSVSGTPGTWIAGPALLDEWVNYTPTYTAGAGTFGAVTTNIARYRRDKRTITVALDFTLTDVGTATGVVRATLPVAASFATAFAGFENDVLGTIMRPSVRPSDLTRVEIATADGGGSAAASRRFIVSGTYEVAT